MIPFSRVETTNLHHVADGKPERDRVSCQECECTHRPARTLPTRRDAYDIRTERGRVTFEGRMENIVLAFEAVGVTIIIVGGVIALSVS